MVVCAYVGATVFFITRVGSRALFFFLFLYPFILLGLFASICFPKVYEA